MENVLQKFVEFLYDFPGLIPFLIVSAITYISIPGTVSSFYNDDGHVDWEDYKDPKFIVGLLKFIADLLFFGLLIFLIYYFFV